MKIVNIYLYENYGIWMIYYKVIILVGVWLNLIVIKWNNKYLFVVLIDFCIFLYVFFGIEVVFYILGIVIVWFWFVFDIFICLGVGRGVGGVVEFVFIYDGCGLRKK